MKTRRAVLACGLALLGATVLPPRVAAARSDPRGFIEDLGNQALWMIRADRPSKQKRAYFHELLQRDFDIGRISRFVLGRYWRLASAQERQQFRTLLADYLVMVYSRRFARYHGERLHVTRTRNIPGGVIVTSQILRLGGAAPIDVDWRLEQHDGFYRIEDVVIDKVSMAITQRSRFAAIIGRQGGQVRGLIAMLRKEVAEAG